MSKLKITSAFLNTIIILLFSTVFSIGCSKSKSSGGGGAVDTTRNPLGLGPAAVSFASPGSKAFNSADMPLAETMSSSLRRRFQILAQAPSRAISRLVPRRLRT